MHSRKSIRERKLARRVESSIRNHLEAVTKGLGEFFAPFVPEGEALPDFAAFLRLQSWVLEGHRLDFQAKDRAHEKELGNDKELRRRRDSQARALHSKMSDISKTFDGAYGEGRCQEILGFGVGLRPEPEQMLELSGQALERLQAPDFAFPTLQLDGVALDAENLRAQLATPHTDLAAAIQALDAEKDKFDASGVAKRAAEENLQGVTGRHARLVEELYRIAGFGEYADRLRPSTHRSKSFRQDDDEASAFADETSGSPSEPGDGDEPRSDSDTAAPATDDPGAPAPQDPPTASTT